MYYDDAPVSETPETTSPVVETPKKRGRGRPKGSKNKPKVAPTTPETTV